MKAIRVLAPYRFSNETVIFLVMQTVDAHLDLHWKRPWFWPFKKQLTSSGARIPTFIPEANEFTKKAAAATGGVGMSSMSNSLQCADHRTLHGRLRHGQDGEGRRDRQQT